MTVSNAEPPASRPHPKKMTSRHKRIVVGVSLGLLAVIATGFGFARFGGPAAVPAISGRPIDPVPRVRPPVVSAMVVRQVSDYRRGITHSGNIRTAQNTRAAFQRDGMVLTVLVDEGESVSPGQPLAELDRRHLQAQYEALSAKREQAQARLAELRVGPRSETIEAARASVDDLNQQLLAARLRLDRSQKLVQSSAIAEQDFERELYATRGLEARLKTAQSQLDELLAGTRAEQVAAQQALVKSIEADQQLIQYQLDDCLLTAPFAGMIVKRMVDPGAVVDAGAPVVELIDHQHLEVHVGVPRETAPRLQPGQACEVIVGNRTVPAVLRTILPTVDSATQTRRAIFDLTVNSVAPDEGLFPAVVDGQLAQIRLEDRIAEPGFWVPATAITSDHSGLWSCLILIPADRTAVGETSTGESSCSGVVGKQSIEVLHQRDDWLFVRGTLEDGQILITNGLHRIVPGQMVTARIDTSAVQPDEDPLILTTLNPFPPAGVDGPLQRP